MSLYNKLLLRKYIVQEFVDSPTLLSFNACAFNDKILELAKLKRYGNVKLIVEIMEDFNYIYGTTLIGGKSERRYKKRKNDPDLLKLIKKLTDDVCDNIQWSACGNKYPITDFNKMVMKVFPFRSQGIPFLIKQNMNKKGFDTYKSTGGIRYYRKID